MGFLGLAAVALLAGTCVFFLIKLVRLTFGAIKSRIIDKLKRKSSSVPTEVVVRVVDLMENAETISLSDLGKDVQMGDTLMFGIKEDGTIDVDVDNFRAQEIDEQLQNVLQKSGALKIDCTV